MTVEELIEILKEYPQDLPVVYERYSEYALMQEEEIGIYELGLPRNDGWVHDARPDKPIQQYVVFPGN